MDSVEGKQITAKSRQKNVDNVDKSVHNCVSLQNQSFFYGEKPGDRVVDKVDNLCIEHAFCAICQVNHNVKRMLIFYEQVE